MKKAILTANMGFTITNFRSEFISTLQEKGFDVLVLCPLEDETPKLLTDLGVRFKALSISRKGLNPFTDLKTFREIRKTYREEKPDVVFQYTIKPVIYGSLAAATTNVKQIFSFITGLGYAFMGASLKRRLIRAFVSLLYKRALKHNTCVFFQNKDDLKMFEDLGFLKAVPTKIINGSGVNFESFCPTNITADPNSFILVARLLRDKGVFEYIEACKKLKESHPSVKCRLMGPLDENPAALKKDDLKRIQEQGIIDYIPGTSNVRPFIEQSEVFVLPSYREGTPRSVLEAMALSKPIITCDVPGCRETVIDGENGYLVPARDARSLHNAMEKFVRRREEIVKMGKKSYEIARKKYDVHKVNASILAEVH